MEENRCPNCNKIANETNFCAECGAPLSDIAKDLENQKTIQTKLETIKDMIALTEDVETLKLLKAYARNILEKK